MISPKNKILDNHINKIVNICLSKVEGVNSIILYGSHGRNEGAWIKNSKQYHPYNDYDLLVVLNNDVKKPTKPFLIKERLLSEIQIKWIDIGYIYRKDIYKNKKTIYWYDLIHGSRVIYGDDKILTKIHHFKSSDIKIKEGEVLFFTRLWAFMGGTEELQSLDQERALFYRYQMAKVVLAAMDMLLLLQGKYVSSYIERVNIATKLCQNKKYPGTTLFKWAIEQKLEPLNTIMSRGDVIVLQNDVANLFSYYTLKVVSQLYRKEFTSITQFIKFYSGRYSEKLKIIIGRALRKDANYKKIFHLNIMQMLIFSYTLSEISERDTINECNKNLGKLEVDHMFDIDQIRKYIAHERLK